ncbi:hypothetical protein BJV74DRAFT_795284 [Russula compacta]|nr:hypothetical protein BJV74DRAFT_795284 [Russula compacta]
MGNGGQRCGWVREALGKGSEVRWRWMHTGRWWVKASRHEQSRVRQVCIGNSKQMWVGKWGQQSGLRWLMDQPLGYGVGGLGNKGWQGYLQCTSVLIGWGYIALSAL